MAPSFASLFGPVAKQTVSAPPFSRFLSRLLGRRRREAKQVAAGLEKRARAANFH